MVEHYLCLMLSGKIHGIKLSKLLPNEDENEGEAEAEAKGDGEYNGYLSKRDRPLPPPLPPPSSFDFTIDLPAWDMQVFSLDSKTYLVGGSDDDDEPCYEIYEFQCDMPAGSGDGDGGDDENKKVRLDLLKSIPEVPVYIDFQNSYIACVSGEAYFLASNDVEFSFWVLRGCVGGEWEPLPLNTLLETQENFCESIVSLHERSKWFYSNNRLFLPCWGKTDSMPDQILSCFDLQTRQWTMEEIYDSPKSMKSFSIFVDYRLRPTVFPRAVSSSVTGLENYPKYSVMLGYSIEYGFFDCKPSKAKIYAMLANQDGICVYQRIRNRHLFKGIKPYFIRNIKEVFFVDLGEGKTCAMIFGFAQQDPNQETGNIVLCISIFTMALKDHEFDVTAYESGKGDERRFLDVRCLSSYVYTIKENLEDLMMFRRPEALDCDLDIQQVFVCPPP